MLPYMHHVASTQVARTAAERAGDKARSRLMRERGTQPSRSAHATRLNVAEFRQFMIAYVKPHSPSVARMAKSLRLGIGTVHKALAGHPINGAFVAALLKATTGTKTRFVDLVTTDADEQAAA